MTQRLKNSTIAASIAVSLLASLTSATDSFAMEPPSTKDSSFNQGNLSLAFQQDLTARGHKLLEQIYSCEAVDLLQSPLFQDMCTKYGKEMGNEYGVIDYLRPTKWVRWYNTSVDDTYNTTRQNQLMGIVAITWALADLSAQQGDSFERGSFTILDPNHSLYNFMLDYVKLTTGNEKPQDIGYVWTASNYAYRRDPILKGSSHHKEHCPQSQFGLDIRFSPDKEPLPLCPHNNTHLLFAQLDIDGQDEPILFIKWEPTGMGDIVATGVHALNFYHSQAHVSDEARREKDILPTIQQSFNDLKKTAGIEGNYKTIRSMVLEANGAIEQALDLINSYGKTNENLLNLPFAEENTIISVNQRIAENPAKIDQQQLILNAAQSFLDFVDVIYPNKNNHLRCGNEVILDLTKI